MPRLYSRRGAAEVPAGTMTRASCAIAFANAKGGCGKTTLVANLAVRCADESSRVVLLDYDPQRSLERWAELRSRGDDIIENPRMGENGHGARDDVRALKGHGAEWIFLDLPPSTMHLIEAGIDVSDFVIIPVKASPIDLEAVDPVIELCEEFRKPFAFLLTMYDPKWKLSESAKRYLERKAAGHTLPEVFGYRQAYVGSMIGGQTGPEYNQDVKQAKAAREEVDALWRTLKKRALSAVRGPAK
jgi:chromosome partitioning protein